MAWWWEWLSVSTKASGCSVPGRIWPQRILDFSSLVNKSGSMGFRCLNCLERLTCYTTHLALLHYTSQCVISLLCCEKHISITSYVVPSEVPFRERKKSRLGSHFLSFPIIPTQSHNTQESTTVQMTSGLEWLNIHLVALSSEWKCLGCFRWCLETSYHCKFCWWQPNQCSFNTGKMKKFCKCWAKALLRK